MKKLILLALIVVIVAGCSKEGIDRHTKEQINIFVFDSCEYIRTYGAYAEVNLAHKGNCRFCAERRKEELKELVNELKDE